MNLEDEKYIGGNFEVKIFIIFLLFNDDRCKYFCMVINVVGLVVKYVDFGMFIVIFF